MTTAEPSNLPAVAEVVEPGVVVGEVVPGPLSAEQAERLRRRIEASKAASTRKAYAADWRAWQRYAAEHGFPAAVPVDPAHVALWLDDLATAGASPKSIGRKLAAIADAHKAQNLPSPSDNEGVRRVVRAIRTEAARQGYRPKQARALTTGQVRAMVTDLDAIIEDPDPKILRLAPIRDKAIILTGYALALRASDVVGLTIEAITRVADGFDVALGVSKTDQDGSSGTVLPLAIGDREQTCPVRALEAWLAALRERGITTGPLFRSVGKGRTEHVGTGRMDTSSVRLILRRAAARAGVSLDRLSPHSLRSGMITTALAGGAEERHVQRTSRHKSLLTLRSYDQSSRWDDPASGHLGL